MSEIVGGTVIQRSFVGREATNIIHIASVPVSELGMENREPEEIFAEILGIPYSSILTEEKYRSVLRAVQF